MNKKEGQKGFTLLEIILAMTIISLALAPISMSLGRSLQIGGGGDTAAKSYHLARAKMEEYLAKPFDEMPEGDANGTAILGQNQVWRVNVSLFDGDGDSNTDPDLKHIYVKAGDQELETLRFSMP